MPKLDEQPGVPEVYVAVTLTKDGGERFAEASGANVERRLAILIDGIVNSAPVVKTRISGGRISITMGGGDPADQLDRARKLADGLIRAANR
jgi:preprotein translocase subunit SecD